MGAAPPCNALATFPRPRGSGGDEDQRQKRQPDVREITRELRLRARSGDPVLALPPSEMPLAFYGSRGEVLHPDLNRLRLFVVENRDSGQTLPKTLAFSQIDPQRYAIRRVRGFGSSALYELRQ